MTKRIEREEMAGIESGQGKELYLQSLQALVILLPST